LKHVLVAPAVLLLDVRYDNPLKQGLKHVGPLGHLGGAVVRYDNPLKQGLKLDAAEASTRPGGSDMTIH